MSTYSVVRVSGDYSVVVVESAVEDRAPKHYFLLKREIGTTTIKKISQKEADGFGSRVADNMGWGDLPQQAFNNLKEVEGWRQQKESEWAKGRHGEHPDLSRRKELFAEFWRVSPEAVRNEMFLKQPPRTQQTIMGDIPEDIRREMEELIAQYQAKQ